MLLMSSKTAAVSGRLGKAEPRISTAPLRELTPYTSLGFEAIETAEEILGESLHPWQKNFLISSLELALGSFSYDEYPALRFKTVLLLVSRQNGKSFIMSRRLLWRMLMWDGPETEPALILGAAHKLPAALEIMELTAKAMQRSGGRKYLTTWNRGTGTQLLETSNGARYKCEAASDDGGRGLSVTDLAFDELRQQREWDAWSALTNTTNARFSPQVLAVSNAGTGKSDVLRGLRKQALNRIAEWEKYVDGGLMDAEEFANQYDTTLGLFEWSAPEGCDIWDREGWAQANPSMGHENAQGVVLLTESMMASKAAQVGALGEDGVPEHVFRTENLCQWVTADIESVFGPGVWDGGVDPASKVSASSKIVLSVDVSHNRDMAYISVAGWRADEKAHVEVIAMREGPEWVVPFLTENFSKTGALGVVVQGKGAPASSMIDHLEAAGIPVIRCEGSGLGAAHGKFFDAVKTKRVFHVSQSVLDVAAADGVMKPLGDVSVWDRRKSPVDVSPLIACAQALWGLEMSVLKVESVSAYEARGVMMV